MTRPASRSPRQRVLSIAIAALVAGWLLPSAASAASDPATVVLDWNRHAIAALGNPPSATPPGAGQAPQVVALHVAMVQGAVFDALNSIGGRYTPYLEDLPPAPAGASRPAAAATAAHHVLLGLVPALPQATRDHLDAQYAASLAAIPAGQAKTDGVAVGAAAAAAMLAERTGDGRFGAPGFPTGTGPGQWRPVLPGFVNDPAAWVATVRPFTLTAADQFRTTGPLALTSAAYAAEFEEVRTLGAQTGDTRNDEQEEVARFVSVAPAPLVFGAIRSVAADRGLSSMAAARLLAMASMASADALINCWDEKRHWGFWRPITAIREAATDGNPATTADPDWLPLFGSPPYPEHASGYNCFTAGAMHATRLFFGSNVARFSITSAGSGTTRDYRRFTQVIHDTINGRVWMGIHFRKADVDGAWIGKKVAQWVERHHFTPAD